MFEITGDDISLLDDEDLRSVVGRLCEAELRRHGHPVSHVTWSGSQTAKDGGLDVRVALPPGAAIRGFIARPQTGFQVKKPDMPRGAIIEEMKPGGVLRSVIMELAAESGAYIIVSSTGSTSDSALRNRRAAMADAVDGAPGALGLFLDFYDRGRIASWVRDHPGLIPWVRSLIGRSIPGWHSHGSWSRTPNAAADSYLIDEKTRVRTSGGEWGAELSAVDGINRIREILREPTRVVRLVGLSGVGKTRFCEALFDPSVGDDYLHPSLAIYTNVADEPNPTPVALASDLNANRIRAILVIDNCPSALHRQLTEIARTEGSTISVLTVEYDIRDDQPEGTDVFALDTSSPKLIEQLVLRRYPDVSQVDAQTISEIAGGNARVALALAATIDKRDSLAGVSDADLFQRLFQQRHEHDRDLFLLAQACSLVYSFNGFAMTGDEAELPVLAALVGKSAQELYGAVAELHRRELLQRRGEWCAILPQAIANRLATQGLQNIPTETITAALGTNGSARLRKSFARRLGYLHESSEARTIVRAWLAPGGMLADLCTLAADDWSLLASVAPVLPDATLATIERAFHDCEHAMHGQGGRVARLLRSLAFEPLHFERTAALLARLAKTAEGESEPISVLTSLFHVVLSGTHAPVAMRLGAMHRLLESDDAKLRALGLLALGALLKTSHFTSFYEFDFGARTRDYGYRPQTHEEVREWFATVINDISPLAASDSSIASQILATIGREFRGLWTDAGQADALEKLATAISARGFWREGWLASRQALIYDRDRMMPGELDRLSAVEKLLRPKSLVDRVQGVVLGSGTTCAQLDEPMAHEVDDVDSAAARLRATIAGLGREVAADNAALKILTPSLLQGGPHTSAFGAALAAGTDHPRQIWDEFLMALARAERPSINVIGGFLSGLQLRHPSLTEALLDEVLEHPVAGLHFPWLQTSVTLNDLGIQRLGHALDLGLASVSEFRALAYGRVADNIPGAAFKDLLLRIAGTPDGQLVAVEILAMRLFSDRSQKRASAPEALETGRALLATHVFRRQGDRAGRLDDELSQIARASLKGSEATPIARRFLRGMMDAIAQREIFSGDYADTLSALAEIHPVVVLDELFPKDNEAHQRTTAQSRGLFDNRSNPLDSIANEVLLKWCDEAPVVRYPLIAVHASLYTRPDATSPPVWTPLTVELFRRAPEPSIVLDRIAHRLLNPISWAGSLAAKLESRLQLLEQLPLSDLPELAPVFERAKVAFHERIAAERSHEADTNRRENMRFE